MGEDGLSQGIISLILAAVLISSLIIIYELYIAPTTGRYCREVIFTPSNIKLVRGCSSASCLITYEALNPSDEPLKLSNKITICLLTDRGRLSCSDYMVSLNRTALPPKGKLTFRIGFLISSRGIRFNMTSSWFTNTLSFARSVKSLKYFTTASWVWQSPSGSKIYYEAGTVCKNYISSGEVGYSGGGGRAT